MTVSCTNNQAHFHDCKSWTLKVRAVDGSGTFYRKGDDTIDIGKNYNDPCQGGYCSFPFDHNPGDPVCGSSQYLSASGSCASCGANSPGNTGGLTPSACECNTGFVWGGSKCDPCGGYVDSSTGVCESCGGKSATSSSDASRCDCDGGFAVSAGGDTLSSSGADCFYCAGGYYRNGGTENDNSIICATCSPSICQSSYDSACSTTCTNAGYSGCSGSSCACTGYICPMNMCQTCGDKSSTSVSDAGRCDCDGGYAVAAGGTTYSSSGQNCYSCAEGYYRSGGAENTNSITCATCASDMYAVCRGMATYEATCKNACENTAGYACSASGCTCSGFIVSSQAAAIMFVEQMITDAPAGSCRTCGGKSSTDTADEHGNTCACD